MKSSSLIAMISLSVVIATVAVTGCAQPSSPAANTAASPTSITSVNQIPAGTWTGTRTESGSTMTITIVATGSTSATMTFVTDMTDQVNASAKKYGMTAAAVWAAMQTQNAAQDVQYSSGSPYTHTKTQNLTNSMLQSAPGSLLNNMLTVKFKNNDDTTSLVTFTKQS